MRKTQPYGARGTVRKAQPCGAPGMATLSRPGDPPPPSEAKQPPERGGRAVAGRWRQVAGPSRGPLSPPQGEGRRGQARPGRAAPHPRPEPGAAPRASSPPPPPQPSARSCRLLTAQGAQEIKKRVSGAGGGRSLLPLREDEVNFVSRPDPREGEGSRPVPRAGLCSERSRGDPAAGRAAEGREALRRGRRAGTEEMPPQGLLLGAPERVGVGREQLPVVGPGGSSGSPEGSGAPCTGTALTSSC